MFSQPQLQQTIKRGKVSRCFLVKEKRGSWSHMKWQLIPFFVVVCNNYSHYLTVSLISYNQQRLLKDLYTCHSCHSLIILSLCLHISTSIFSHRQLWLSKRLIIIFIVFSGAIFWTTPRSLITWCVSPWSRLPFVRCEYWIYICICNNTHAPAMQTSTCTITQHIHRHAHVHALNCAHTQRLPYWYPHAHIMFRPMHIFS